MKLSDCVHHGHFVFYNGRPRRLQILIAQLEEKNESLRKLAYDYIQAYEKLAFADALTAEEQEDEDATN